MFRKDPVKSTANLVDGDKDATKEIEQLNPKEFEKLREIMEEQHRLQMLENVDSTDNTLDSHMANQPLEEIVTQDETSNTL